MDEFIQNIVAVGGVCLFFGIIRVFVWLISSAYKKSRGTNNTSKTSNNADEEINQYDTVHDENGKEWTVSSVEETEVHLTDGHGDNRSISIEKFLERRRAERSTAEESGRTLGTEGTLEAEMPTIMQEEQQVAGRQQTADNYPRNEKDEIDYGRITDPMVYWVALQSEFGGYASVILDVTMSETNDREKLDFLNNVKKQQTTEESIDIKIPE